jgi:hypothetical protein
VTPGREDGQNKQPLFQISRDFGDILHHHLLVPARAHGVDESSAQWIGSGPSNPPRREGLGTVSRLWLRIDQIHLSLSLIFLQRLCTICSDERLKGVLRPSRLPSAPHSLGMICDSLPLPNNVAQHAKSQPPSCLRLDRQSYDLVGCACGPTEVQLEATRTLMPTGWCEGCPGQAAVFRSRPDQHLRDTFQTARAKT